MFARDIPQALQELADVLTALGVPSTIIADQIEVPGAWVAVDRIDAQALCGDVDLTAAVYALAPDNQGQALVDLCAMVDTINEAMPGVQTITPDSLAIPGHAAPLPAFKMTIQV